MFSWLRWPGEMIWLHINRVLRNAWENMHARPSIFTRHKYADLESWTLHGLVSAKQEALYHVAGDDLCGLPVLTGKTLP